jgi:hypothetical protein
MVMKQRARLSGRALALVLGAVICAISSASSADAQTPTYPQSPAYPDPNPPQAQQPQGQQRGRAGASQASEAEMKEAKAVQDASDTNAALAAASAFVKKHPKSGLRARVARMVADRIGEEHDAAQRATFAESAAKIFDRPEESGVINPVLLNAYVDAKRYDDVFRVGSMAVEKNPEDVSVRTQMALIGIDQARLGNAKFVTQSQQYAAKAVELIEANKKPADMSDADWSAFKAEWLPQLYQSLGMLSYVSHNPADARAKLEKAVALGSLDPTTYALLADMSDREYSDNASKINAMKIGAERDAALRQAQDNLDKVIELYAQAVALSDGKSGYEKMHEQLLTPLTSYYKYRKGSTEGLQQLIDKYKKNDVKLN